MPADEFLARELERLLALPLETPEDAEHWGVVCREIQATMENRFPSFEIEHQVWHFLSDYDIRQRDAAYRQRQHKAMADYATHLRTAIGESA